VSWITIIGPSSASGNGSVTLSVAEYKGKWKKRKGTATIAGMKFTVKQRGRSPLKSAR
jgi:hypothetical protein